MRRYFKNVHRGFERLILPRGYIDGMILSNDAFDTNHAINVAAGQCRDSLNVMNFEMSELTKTIDETWVAGDDVGGLNATDFATGGSDAEASTWYHLFSIAHLDGWVDAGFDKDVTATNLLSDSGCTWYRRLGSVLTDAGKSILAFQQRGDYFMWQVPTLDYDSGAALGDAEASPTVRTPLGVKTLAVLNAVADQAANNRYVWVYSDYHTSATPSKAAAPLCNVLCGPGGTENAVQVTVETDTSSTVRARADGANTDLLISTVGWIDSRGKDA